MVAGEKVISNELEVANIPNSFFENAISNLGISQTDEYIVNSDYILHPINAIKYSEHPSILKIKEIASWPTFTLNLCNINEIENEIIKLNAKTSVSSEHVSAYLLKDYSDICSGFLLNIINYDIMNSTFDDGMKLADITPVPKEEHCTNKELFRAISVLPAGTKEFYISKSVPTLIRI